MNIELVEISGSIQLVLVGVCSLGLASNGTLVLVGSCCQQLRVVILRDRLKIYQLCGSKSAVESEWGRTSWTT